MKGVPLSSLWMLVLRGTPPKVLWCKSDRFVSGSGTVNAPNGMLYNNFQDQYQISYSIVYPWSGTGTSPNWRGNMDNSAPVMCDMAPLSGSNNKNTTMLKGQTTKAYNSSNHDDAGQNVAFGDGHVEFCREPYQGGSGQDNIFTTGPTSGQQPAGLNNVGAPISTNDWVMVPVRDAGSGAMGN
jgi:prepilin-type processing-associated H-X9-DG protein